YSLLLSSFPRHCSVILRPPAPPLFPYTTLFRSILTTPEGARKVDTAPLKAACGSADEDRGLVVAGLRHRLEPAEGVLERHGHDLRTAQGDHLPTLLLQHDADDGHTVARREHAVVGTRGAAALDVAECRGARLDACALLDLGSELVADAAEARAPEGVEAALGVRVVHGVELEALGDHDERRAAAGASGVDPAADLIHARLALGDEDRVRAGSHSRVQGDPADVTAHDL